MSRTGPVGRSAGRLLVALGLLALAAGFAPQAAVTFTLDKSTLNDILSQVTLEEVEVPLAAGRTLTVRIEDLVVTGLVPAAGKNGEAYILTSMRLVVPDLGIRVNVEPRISLHVERRETETLLEMRFEDVPLRLPLTGGVNVAPLLPPLRYPTDNVWLLAGSRGDVPIASRLRRIDVGQEAIRFLFDVEVMAPVAGTP